MAVGIVAPNPDGRGLGLGLGLGGGGGSRGGAEDALEEIAELQRPDAAVHLACTRSHTDTAARAQLTAGKKEHGVRKRG